MTPYLLIRKIKIQNANAMSSPITIGFPAMTAWLGSIHALERRLRQRAALSDLHFSRMAIACHTFDLQTYRGHGDYVDSVIITANPLLKKGANFERPPFIEEARVHLTISLLVELDHITSEMEEQLPASIAQELPRMKFAGGDILPEPASLKLLYHNPADPAADRNILRQLAPSYLLVERRDLMETRMAEGESGADALLHFLEIQYQADHNDAGEVFGWNGKKAEPGWLVPIAVGFKGLSPLEQIDRQRDAETPHRFAESVITLGEFKMPHHFQQISDVLWKYEYLPDKNLYLCTNQ